MAYLVESLTLGIRLDGESEQPQQRNQGERTQAMNANLHKLLQG
jgi:hypothetical protein